MEHRWKQCDSCGGDLLRMHRRLTEKIFYLSVYRCSVCEVQTARARPFTLWLARSSKCPRCGNTRLNRMLERRRLERLYARPLALTQSLLRAKLYHCPECDLQYHARNEGTCVRSRVWPVRKAEESSIHPDSLTGDEIGFWSGQKCNGAGDIERLPDALQRR